MHKNPHQNAGNGIKETLFFKIFLGSMPPDPPRGSRPYAYGASTIHLAVTAEINSFFDILTPPDIQFYRRTVYTHDRVS